MSTFFRMSCHLAYCLSPLSKSQEKCYDDGMKKALNFTAISKKYGPGYMARLDGTTRVVAFAKRADALIEKIKDKKEFKENKLVIGWVPKYGQTYVFRISLRVCGG